MEENKSMKRNMLIMAILLFLSVGTNIYYLSDDSYALELLSAENTYFKQKDSMQSALTSLEDSLNAMELQLKSNSANQNDLDELQLAKTEILKLRSQLKENSTTTVIRPGSPDNRKLLKELELAKAKIASLTAEIGSLKEKNNYLFAENDRISERNQTLNSINIDLEDRLARGKRVQFGSLMTFGMTEDGRKSNKVNQIQKLSITFDALENPLITDVVSEEIIIRVIDPNGGVLSTTNTNLQDKNTVTSITDVLIFDGSLQKVKWAFPQKGILDRKLIKGKYTSELWSRGLLRQKNTFELN